MANSTSNAILIASDSSVYSQLTSNAFHILSTKSIQLSPEQASDFYASYSHLPCFSQLTLQLCSQPIHVLLLQKPNAVADLLQLASCNTLSLTQSTIAKSLHVIHFTLSASDIATELSFFFPERIFSNKESLKSIYPVLEKGLAELVKVKPENPVRWLGEWLLRNNPNRAVKE